MDQLLSLLSDGRARTVELLAVELQTDMEDVKRKLEYLEMIGLLKRISPAVSGCKSCSGCQTKDGCNAATCKGCLPEGGFKNMGETFLFTKPFK